MGIHEPQNDRTSTRYCILTVARKRIHRQLFLEFFLLLCTCKVSELKRIVTTKHLHEASTYQHLHPHLSLTGNGVLKNGNMLLSQTASISSSLVSKRVVNTGLLFGNSSRCARATTPSLSLIISCASGDKHLSISILSSGSSFPMALPPNLVSHSTQTLNAASMARAGGVRAA